MDNYIQETIDVEPEDTSSGNIDKPFDPKKIDIVTKQMILEVIFRRLRNEEIDLYTVFQRGRDLWDRTKQSRLIESILIRLPLPAFYFDGTDDNRWLVVDGLQRLSTFDNFVINKNLNLQNLEFLTNFEGFTFDRLPRDLQRRIEEHEITVYIINPGTPHEVKFNLFRRINTGGLILNSQEIRHALNQGIPAEFVKKLAKTNNAFKKATSNSVKPDRMLDRDFITRFIAFYLYKSEEYKPDLDSFLNKAMAELNNLSEQDRKKIENDFIKGMNAAYEIFDKDAFRKRYNKGDKRKPINKALFEVWSVLLSKLNKDEIAQLIQNKDVLANNFINLLNSKKDFENSISTGTGDPKNLKIRFKEINNLIKEILE